MRAALQDWRDPTDYPDGEDWTLARWRWEFVRRRDDVWAAFDGAKEATFARKKELFARCPEMFGGVLLAPDDPGFLAEAPLSEEIGYSRGIPNPAIGDQPFWAIPWDDAPGTLNQFISDDAPDGFARIDFDLSRPLRPQIESAQRKLKFLQQEHAGRAVQKKRHKAKWPTYLRVLDARADGASLAQIAEILTATDGTPHAARDALKQARALCFNF